MIEIIHLSEDQISRCSEALAIDNSINLSDKFKNHLKICDECHTKVDLISDALRNEYKRDVAEKLSSTSQHQEYPIFIWIGIAVSIMVSLGLGIVFTH